MRWRSGFRDLDRTLEELRRVKGRVDTAAIMKRKSSVDVAYLGGNQ